MERGHAHAFELRPFTYETISAYAFTKMDFFAVMFAGEFSSIAIASSHLLTLLLVV